MSVVVCTRDRPDQLALCLDSLERLTTPPHEVVVVDNAPSDDATRRVCEARPVRYLLEPLPGQTRARNRGIRESSGALVAFTDDDCAVDPRWLDSLPEAFADPLVMVATGYIGPLEVDGESQYLFELHGGFERHSQHVVLDPRVVPPLIAAAGSGAGANMVFRREVFEHVGLFAEDLGPGTPARSSDDKYAFYLALREGFRIDYDPRRIVWHRHRREREALLRILNDYGVAEFAYTFRCLVEHRDPYAIRIWRYWVEHFLADVRRWVRRHPDAVPLSLTAAEIRGAFAGPAAMGRSARSREGIPPITLDATLPAPAPEGVARVQVATADLPDMSVALASYNRREQLRRTLERLGDQSLPAERFEVNVVLDGSTDGSAEMLAGLEVPYRLNAIEQPNRGLAATRNRGAKAAANPVVVFLDDDIEPEPQWLVEHGLAHAEAAHEQVVLGAYPPVVRAEGWWGREVRGWWDDHFRRKESPGHRWSFTDVLDGNMSLPLSLFGALEGFDERFRSGRRQDWELGVRLLRQGVRLAYRPQARGLHRFDPALATAARNAWDEGRYDVLLVELHPEARFGLPLGRYLERERLPLALGPRMALLRGGGARATLATARTFERLGMQRRWQQATTVLLITNYLRGVRDGLGKDDGDLADYLRPESPPGRRPVEVDIAAGSQGPTGFSPDEDLVLHHTGRAFTSLPPILPGNQWDWDEFTTRAAGAAAGPLTMLLADEPAARDVE